MIRTSRQTTHSAHDLETAFGRFEPLRIRYASNELICQSGSYAAGVYLMTTGIVLETYAGGTREAAPLVTGLLCTGDLIGIEPLSDGENMLHQTSCRALSSVSLSFLERGAFNAALEVDPGLRQYLTAYLADRSHRLVRALWRTRLAADERLRDVFLHLAPLASGDGASIRLPRELDLRLIADLAGVPLRRARQACTALHGVEWTDEGFRLSLAKLSDPRAVGRG